MRTSKILFTALVLAAIGAGTVTAASNASSSVTVIHEPFTLLPCTGSPRDRTTLQLEGCAEHKVVASDQRIDALAKQVFASMNHAGRTAFLAASADWLAYRTEYCSAEASPYAGGTLASVLYPDCLQTENLDHIAELKRLRAAISSTG